MVVYKLDSWFAASAINAIQSHAIHCWQRTTRVSYAHTRDPVWACDRYLGQGGCVSALCLSLLIARTQRSWVLWSEFDWIVLRKPLRYAMCGICRRCAVLLCKTTSSIWQPMLREGRPIYLFYRKDLSLLIDASFVFLYKLEWILLNNNINVNNLIKIDISLIDPRGNRSAKITIKATLLISYAKEDSIS